MASFHPVSENSYLILFGDKISEPVLEQVSLFTTQITAVLGDKLVDITPSYTSVLLRFNPMSLDYAELEQLLTDTLTHLETGTPSPISSEVTQLPVFYAAQTGPDLYSLSREKQLSVAEIIKIHSQTVYRIYAIGFSPGFPYLGVVDPRIQAARLSTPRLKVPKGSVGIADNQTGIYPQQTPGGWRIIGNCPIPLFDKDKGSKLSVGGSIQFQPITEAEFLRLGGNYNDS